MGSAVLLLGGQEAMSSTHDQGVSTGHFAQALLAISLLSAPTKTALRKLWHCHGSLRRRLRFALIRRAGGSFQYSGPRRPGGARLRVGRYECRLARGNSASRVSVGGSMGPTVTVAPKEVCPVEIYGHPTARTGVIAEAAEGSFVPPRVELAGSPACCSQMLCTKGHGFEPLCRVLPPMSG